MRFSVLCMALASTLAAQSYADLILEPGKLAGLAVLSSDILTIDPADIAKVKVAMTIFDGRVIYDRHE